MGAGSYFNEYDEDVEMEDINNYDQVLNFGRSQIMISKSAGWDTEVHFLCKAILKIILYLIVPHYVLVGLIHYLYKPRLALMIYRFKSEIMERKKLLKTFKI